MADFEERSGLEPEIPQPESENYTQPESENITQPVPEQAADSQPAPEQAVYTQQAAPEQPVYPQQPQPQYGAQSGPYGAYNPYGERRGAYADAGYVPASDAGAMPRSYSFTAQTERKPKKEKRARRGMHPAAVIALCLVCAILGGLAGGYAPRLTNRNTPAVEQTVPDRGTTSGASDSTVLTVANSGSKTVTTNTVVSGGELSPTELYYNVALQQVVGVKTEITYTNVFGYTSKGAVSGSGFIISEDGYILTNYHVIENAVTGGYDVQVLMQDGTSYIATVVGYEADNDVAVLKIDAVDLNAAVIGDSDAMLVGEKVYAVGNPLGELEYTMTDGMVSAKDREIRSTDAQTGQTKTINMFQISAAINSGNSGGPVYNARGEVIGIATAKYSDTGVEGLGFAIPINDAVRIAKDLINDGFVRGKAYMGINVGTVTASAAQYYGLVQGAIVASVEEGSCAAAAGLKESDIIVAIDGKEITSGAELINAKKNYSAGDTAVLKVYRDSQYIELSITFDEATPERAAAAAEEQETQETPSQRQQTTGGYEDFFREFFGNNPFGR